MAKSGGATVSPPATVSEFVSAAEFARRFNISVSAVYNAIRDGKVKSVRLGCSVRIPRSEVIRVDAKGF